MAISHSVASAIDGAGNDGSIGSDAIDKSAIGTRWLNAATASVSTGAEVVRRDGEKKKPPRYCRVQLIR